MSDMNEQDHSLQPLDALQFLQANHGDFTFRFDRVRELLTPRDREDQQRREAILNEVYESAFNAMKYGQFRDMAGIREIMDDLGAERIVLMQPVVDLMKEFAGKVDDNVEVLPPGGTTAGFFVEDADGNIVRTDDPNEATRIMEERVLIHSGYPEENISEIRERYHTFVNVLRALRWGPYDDHIGQAFWQYALPLFAPGQQEELLDIRKKSLQRRSVFGYLE